MMTQPQESKPVKRVVNLFGGSTVASLGEHLIHDHAQIEGVAMVILYKDDVLVTLATDMANSDLALLSRAFQKDIDDSLFG